MCMDRPKVDEKWVGKRLTTSNIQNYLKNNNFNLTKIKDNFIINGIQPFLQKDYGGKGDCTLTSILTIVKYYKLTLNNNEIYNYIEIIAKKYLYGENRGTFSFFNKSII